MYGGGLCVEQNLDKAENFLADILNANGGLVTHGIYLQVDVHKLRTQDFLKCPMRQHWIGVSLKAMGAYLETHPNLGSIKTLTMAKSCYEKAIEFGSFKSKADLKRVQEKLQAKDPKKVLGNQEEINPLIIKGVYASSKRRYKEAFNSIKRLTNKGICWG